MTPETEKEMLASLKKIADSLEELVDYAKAVGMAKFQMQHVPSPAERRLQQAQRQQRLHP